MGLPPDTLPLDAERVAPVAPMLQPIRPARAPIDWVVALTCVSVAITALVMASVQVFLFAQTDAVTSQLGQAGLLFFGVSSLAAIPFGIVAWFAFKTRPRPILTTLLMLPWIVIGGMWIALSRFDWIIGAVPMIVAVLAIVWAWLARRQLATHSAEIEPGLNPPPPLQ